MTGSSHPPPAAGPVALRMDDVGASTKRYEVYSKRQWGRGPLKISGNWLFLKYLPPFKAWGPYRELTAGEWRSLCDSLSRTSAKLTVGLTAAWAERHDRITPFPRRAPDAAAVLREGVRAGLLEIANHGLTHCVLDGNKFRPRLWTSNRTFHREFWDWVPPAVQESHIRQSQEILQEYFGEPVVTFVPPGNVFTATTLEIASRYGLRYVSCDTAPGRAGPMTVIGNEGIWPFHDRDIVYGGIRWLDEPLRAVARRSCFVRDLGAAGAAMADARSAGIAP